MGPQREEREGEEKREREGGKAERDTLFLQTDRSH